MIYLDVTAGCTLPLQSGIPRTTRGVARIAQGCLGDVLPIRWQPFRSSYTRLSRRAAAILQDPASQAARQPPRDTTGSLLLAAWRDLAPPWPRPVPLHRQLARGDTLLLTSLFPDNRLGYLEALINSPGRKVALFHDAIPLRDANVRPWERRRHERALRLLARLDLVIAVSMAARSDLLLLLAEHRLLIPKLAVLSWPAPFATPRLPFAPPPPPMNVLYVSRLKQLKNHATLLAACELLWEEGLSFSLTLIGCADEPRETAAVLREIRRMQRRGRNVAWHAQVSEHELHRAYAQCSFTVFPSHREGFGLPIVESFWHGRGVICSGRDAMGEVSHGPGSIQVDVTRPEKIAEAMRRLLHDEAPCLELARLAYARPQRTWDDYGRELQGLIAP